MDIVLVLIRLAHVLAGMIWVGFAFFFMFILAPILPRLNPDAQRSLLPPVVRSVAPWSAAIIGTSIITGLILLGFIFHGAGIVFEEGYTWGPLAGILILLALVFFAPYNIVSKSAIGKNHALMALLMIAVSVGFVALEINVAGFTYRAALIHLGMSYGLIMGANMMMLIIPAQKRIVAAMESGTPPQPADFGIIQQRGIHNVFLSMPIIWAMLNQHTVVVASQPVIWLGIVLLLNWAFVAYLVRPKA